MICKKLWKIIILTSLFVLVAGGLWGQATFTWTGADPTSPNAWEEAGNWQVEGSVPVDAPDTADDVDIPGSLSSYPITPGSSLAIASLTIANGASLTLGGALTVTGAITNTGTIALGGGIL